MAIRLLLKGSFEGFYMAIITLPLKGPFRILEGFFCGVFRALRRLFAGSLGVCRKILRGFVEVSFSQVDSSFGFRVLGF